MMIRRITALVTLLAIINLGVGCTKITSIQMDEIPDAGKEERQVAGRIDKIKSVQLKSGDKIGFEEPGGIILANSNVVVGITGGSRKGRRRTGGERVEIKLEEIQHLYFKESNPALTRMLVGGLVLVLVVVISALVEASSIGSPNLN